MPEKVSAFEYLREKARKTGSLLSLHFDITYRCPERCIHCYIDDRRQKELSTQEIETILKDARDMNVLFITYSGGEVFIRKDFVKILKITRRLGFSIKLITSGYLIQEKEVKILKDLKVLNVGVSLYSHKAETHDRITSVKGSFEKTVNAIKLLNQAKISVTIKTSIMKDNYRDYPELLKWIKSLGDNVYSQYDMVITPTMNNRKGVKDLNVPFEEKKTIYREIKRIENRYETKIEEMENSTKIEKAHKSITCYAGITGLYIAPDGKVSPCVEWNELLGDLRKERLSDIWKNSERLRHIKSLRIKDYKKCVGCKYLSTCSICSGLNLRDNNDIFEPSELACQRARVYYEKE